MSRCAVESWGSGGVATDSAATTASHHNCAPAGPMLMHSPPLPGSMFGQCAMVWKRLGNAALTHDVIGMA